MLGKIKDWKVRHFFLLFFAFMWGAYFYNEAWKAWNDHPVISWVLGGSVFFMASLVCAVSTKWTVKILKEWKE